MGLLNFFRAIKGNFKCGVCGSYHTKIVTRKTRASEQRWETDWSIPRGSNGLRLQYVFDVRYDDIVIECSDCNELSLDIDIVKRRA